MHTLGFINHVSNQFIATHNVITNIREFYIDAPIFLSVDGKYDNRFRTTFIGTNDILFNEINLGYPPYNKASILEWLKRMYIGVLKLNTNHFMMLEDDCVILNQIKFNENIECLGHVIDHGNKIHNSIIHEIENFSKKQPLIDYYGTGGGSIFKSSTFLNNYYRIIDYIDNHWTLYEDIYHPQCGYMDFYMVLFYMLCGKDYTPNIRLKNLDPHNAYENNISKNGTIDEIKKLYETDYDCVHNWKLFYN